MHRFSAGQLVAVPLQMEGVPKNYLGKRGLVRELLPLDALKFEPYHAVDLAGFDNPVTLPEAWLVLRQPTPPRSGRS
jgi:hypothetical protein